MVPGRTRRGVCATVRGRHGRAHQSPERTANTRTHLSWLYTCRMGSRMARPGPRSNAVQLGGRSLPNILLQATALGLAAVPVGSLFPRGWRNPRPALRSGRLLLDPGRPRPLTDRPTLAMIVTAEATRSDRRSHSPTYLQEAAGRVCTGIRASRVPAELVGWLQVKWRSLRSEARYLPGLPAAGRS